MFFDFVNALLNFDIAWLAWLVGANIIFLFAFIALCFFFWEGNTKKIIAGVFLLSIVAWLWVDFEIMSGWSLLVGGFLAIYYVTKFLVLVFVENSPSLKNKLIAVSEIHFLLLLIGYNLFLG